MSESIDNLLNKLEEICEYYVAHNKPGDAMDIRTAVSEYHKESGIVDICDYCKHTLEAMDMYPCCDCMHCGEDMFEDIGD